MYKLEVVRDFKDKYDETKKYTVNEIIEVEEERAFELLSSETPVVRYIFHEPTDGSELSNRLKELEDENKRLLEDKELLETTVNSLMEEIKTLEDKLSKEETPENELPENENKESKNKKKSNEKDTDKE